MTLAHDAAFMSIIDPAFPIDGDAALYSALIPKSLDALEATVRRDLDLTGYPIKSWVLPRAAPDGSTAYNVVIVGGGQSGLTTAYALLRQRVSNVLVLDENEPGLEGPWNNYARMRTLRSDKWVGGMDLGLPSLSIRAWYECQYGAKAWQDLGRLPRMTWHAYLQWYRKVLNLPVINRCRLITFDFDETSGLLRLEVEDKGQRRLLWTRKLVIATGIKGNGDKHVPDIVDDLPRERWAHTHDAIDFDALKGRTVAVLGGAASAFDNATLAAETGAAHIHLYHRRKRLNFANPVAWGQFNGFLAHFADLDLPTRWRFMHHMHIYKPGPTVDTYTRAIQTPNIAIHAGVSWERAWMEDGRISILATDGLLGADFIILGTGYELDLGGLTEFSEHFDKIALWKDIFTPPGGEEDENLSQSPFVGSHFELQEREPGSAPWLRNVFNFNRGAQLSMGSMVVGLTGLKTGVTRLAQGITKQLFADDAASYLEGMKLWQAKCQVAET